MRKYVIVSMIVCSLVVIVISAFWLLRPLNLCPLDDRLDGCDWEKLSQEERVGFAFGYALGYRNGSHYGCSVGAYLFGPPDPLSVDVPSKATFQCIEELPEYRAKSFLQAEQITAYYRQYPEDQGVAVEEVFYVVRSGRAQDPEEIYAEIHNLR